MPHRALDPGAPERVLREDRHDAPADDQDHERDHVDSDAQAEPSRGRTGVDLLPMCQRIADEHQ